MNIYEKMWIERKKELLDKIGKAPNPNAASRDVEELTSMIRQEVFASTKELQMKPGRVVGLCAVHITPGNVEHTTAEREKIFQELKEAATPMLKYLNEYFDPHTTAVITEGRVTIVRDEISVPLPVRD